MNHRLNQIIFNVQELENMLLYSDNSEVTSIHYDSEVSDKLVFSANPELYVSMKMELQQSTTKNNRQEFTMIVYRDTLRELLSLAFSNNLEHIILFQHSETNQWMVALPKKEQSLKYASIKLVPYVYHFFEHYTQITPIAILKGLDRYEKATKRQHVSRAMRQLSMQDETRGQVSKYSLNFSYNFEVALIHNERSGEYNVAITHKTIPLRYKVII